MNTFMKAVIYMRTIGEDYGEALISETRALDTKKETIARVAFLSAAFKYAFGYEEGE